MTTTQREELDKRYADYQNGIGKTYTWDETVAIAEQAVAERRAFINTLGRNLRSSLIRLRSNKYY